MFKLSMRSMLLLTMTCNVCGRVLPQCQREDAVDDEKMQAVTQNPDGRLRVLCPKCGQVTRNRRVVNRVYGRRVV